MILNIVDAKIDADVTVMSPDEFARKIEESKRQFVVNINDNLTVEQRKVLERVFDLIYTEYSEVDAAKISNLIANKF